MPLIRSRCAVKLYMRLLEGVSSITDTLARLRLLLRWRDLLREVLAIVEEEVDHANRELRDEGMSVRQIATLTGQARATVAGAIERSDRANGRTPPAKRRPQKPQPLPADLLKG